MSFVWVSDSQVLYLFVVVVFIVIVMNILKIAATRIDHISLVREYSS